MMNVKIDWLIEKRVIYAQYPAVVDADNIRDADVRINALLNEGTERVHLINDTRFIEKFPTNIAQLHKITSFLRNPNLGWSIGVAESKMLTFIGSVLVQIGSNTRYRIYKTIEETTAFLQNQDTSVDWSAARLDLIPVREK